ncbi:MAG: hypothetical protein GXO55_03770 [Chloroflexi bacterium]|nr:hypothetical protein [Chloroflexota bacterium]
MAQNRYLRFRLSYRIQHLIMLISFTLLAITGLPQKYPDTGWAIALFKALGGIERARVIHHTAAVVLVLVSIYHLVDVGYALFVLRAKPSILPSKKDVVDFIQSVKYNLGLTDQRPLYDRYNFVEKLEYLALVWGTVLMALTGFVLWNPITVTRYLPGEVVPASKVAHGMEAILAVLSILTWHSYFVHIRHFNKSMFTGYMDEEEMWEEHPLELERLRRGEIPPPPPPEERWRRARVYIPLATVFSLLLILGIWRFLTLEQTAITTLPTRARVEKPYQPVAMKVLPRVTPGTPTPPPRRVVTPTPLPRPITSHGVTGDLAQCHLCHAVDGLVAPAPLDHKGWPDSECLSCHPAQGGER